jgi:hypothetical protein
MAERIQWSMFGWTGQQKKKSASTSYRVDEILSLCHWSPSWLFPKTLQFSFYDCIPTWNAEPNYVNALLCSIYSEASGGTKPEILSARSLSITGVNTNWSPFNFAVKPSTIFLRRRQVSGGQKSSDARLMFPTSRKTSGDLFVFSVVHNCSTAWNPRRYIVSKLL